MPSPTSLPEDGELSEAVCREWGVRFTNLDISGPAGCFSDLLDVGGQEHLRRGNITSRCRMIVLFDAAREERSLVVGTTNRSEYLMGYMTKFGDGAEDIMPLATFYKTQIWEIASMIGVPGSIIGKVPTAGLWEGQTDEGEMGISYRDLDRILACIEAGLSDTEIASVPGLRHDMVAEIRRRISSSEHKRHPAVVPDVKGFRSDAGAVGQPVHCSELQCGDGEAEEEEHEPLGGRVLVAVVEDLREQVAGDHEHQDPRGQGYGEPGEPGFSAERLELDDGADRGNGREQGHRGVGLPPVEYHRHGG